MKGYYERKPKQICSTCDEPLFARRDWEKCSNCNDIKCLKHIYSYVDESNIAITKNSPLFCRICYREKYD